ncbi:hypothetical protein HKK72_32070 [Actinomadura sp. HBU206391]|nr:hypothetical protein [Actinomadura sp. HBU206391]
MPIIMAPLVRATARAAAGRARGTTQAGRDGELARIPVLSSGEAPLKLA